MPSQWEMCDKPSCTLHSSGSEAPSARRDRPSLSTLPGDQCLANSTAPPPHRPPSFLPLSLNDQWDESDDATTHHHRHPPPGRLPSPGMSSLFTHRYLKSLTKYLGTSPPAPCAHRVSAIATVPSISTVLPPVPGLVLTAKVVS